MNRQQKEQIIADLHHTMSEAQATFLVNYKGLSVSAMQKLRKNLRSVGSKFKVTKATLMQRAAHNIEGADTFAEAFKDQVGFVFVNKDISDAAKQLSSFAQENESLKVIAGFYASKMLSKQEFDVLASLPSREVLIAHLLGTMQAPIAASVRILHMLIARLVIVLKEIEKKQAGN